MTALLVLGFGVPPATAVGADLLYAGITNISGNAVDAFHRNAVCRITLRLACGSLPAAALSLLLLAGPPWFGFEDGRRHHDDAGLRAVDDRGRAGISQMAASATDAPV